MAKRKQQPPDEGSPEWMSTFSDLMNLLLCFFVMLFASSTMDAGKLQKIAASFENMSFSVLPQGAISLIKDTEISGGVTQLPDIMSVLSQVGLATDEAGNNVNEQAAGEDAKDNEKLSDEELAEQMEQTGMEQSEEMYEEIKDLAESYSIEDMVEMDYNSQYVELDMNGSILFESGEADFMKESEIFLQKIASILMKYRNCIIEFEGHTDNVPMNSDKFESNRYLSVARATKVYEYIMTQESLIEKNIKIAGYGEERPVESNDTAEGRARNRRVVVKIYNQLNTALEEGDSLR